MSSFILTIPDFKFSGLYYPQVMQSFTAYRRIYLADLNDEDPNDDVTQVFSGVSAALHYAAVLLDHVGLETTLPSCRLRSSAKQHLALIGYKIAEAVPARATLLLKIASQLTVANEIPALSSFATEDAGVDGSISYELIETYPISPTTAFTKVFSLHDGEFADVTEAASGTGTASPWGATSLIGSSLYFGHDSCLWEKFKLAMAAIPDIFDDEERYSFEYYDESTVDSTPSDMSTDSAVLEFVLTSLLGTNPRSGVEVLIRYIPTGAYETVVSEWSGLNIGRTTSLLGQVTPSLNLDDYTIVTHWKELPSLTITSDGGVLTVQFPVPENALHSWVKTTVNDVEAYWVRLRAIDEGYAAPTLSGVSRPAQGACYAKIDVVQGQTRDEYRAGAFSGEAGQTFTTLSKNVIDGTVRVFVDEGDGGTEYTEAPDLFAALSTATVFTVSYDDDGYATVAFGDGAEGRLPVAGADLLMTYRHSANTDGNVGAGAIRINESSASFVQSVTNKRAASGWEPPEGSTKESLARLKVDGPASLRLLERAITSDDVRDLALRWKDAAGAKPIERAVAVVDGAGERSYGLTIVGPGGAYLPVETLEDIATYFVGDPLTGAGGRLIGGYDLAARNYSRRVIDVTITIKGGDVEKVSEAISNYLSPNYVRDGAFAHEFGATIYPFNIQAIAAAADSAVETVVSMASPAAPIVLAEDELPFPGTITVVRIP